MTTIPLVGPVKRICVMVTAMLTACAGAPPAPDWQINAKSALERATTAYLTGRDRIEALEFANARNAMASTGQATLVARAELIRCATRIASLVLDDCSAFERLREDAAAPERVYADYLAGRALPADAALLPIAHRRLVDATSETAATALAGIDDPLARLVAAGVLMRTHRADPAVMTVAVETASNQGWRRPLLAWLTAQALRAERLGDTVQLQQLQRRLDLVRASPTP